MPHKIRQLYGSLITITLLTIGSNACSAAISSTPAPPITQVVQVIQIVPATQIIPVTQIILVTQIVPVTQIIPPVDNTQIINPSLQASFVGQDGENYAGRLCEPGGKKDNIHIRLYRLRIEKPVRFRVQDIAGGGNWAIPCNPVSDWTIVVFYPAPGQADIYFKPFRNAPDGTEYTITITYADGWSQKIIILGSSVTP